MKRLALCVVVLVVGVGQVEAAIVSWGLDDDNQVTDTPSGTGFTAVASGDNHNLALTSVPEPSSIIIWSLIGLTFAGIGWWRRRKA